MPDREVSYIVQIQCSFIFHTTSVLLRRLPTARCTIQGCFGGICGCLLGEGSSIACEGKSGSGREKGMPVVGDGSACHKTCKSKALPDEEIRAGFLSGMRAPAQASLHTAQVTKFEGTT